MRSESRDLGIALIATTHDHVFAQRSFLGNYPLPVAQVVLSVKEVSTFASRYRLLDVLADTMQTMYGDWCSGFEGTFRLTPDKSMAVATVRCVELKDNRT